MEKLVSFPTVSRDTNIPLIDWVADYLAGHGIDSHRYIDPDQPKHALFAHVGPVGGGGRRAVGAHGRGAGRRPAVGHGPVHRCRTRRQVLSGAAPAT